MNFLKTLSIAAVTLSLMLPVCADPKTTIVATFGPATSSVEKAGGIINAGVDFARINFSHGSHESNAKLIQSIRDAAAKLGKNIPIIIDLQGPKYRIGKFADGKISLQKGDKFVLDTKSELGDKNRVQFSHLDVYPLMKAGAHIMLRDGKIVLKATKVNKDSIETEVEVGGDLPDKQGVNLPDLTGSVKVLTEKDKDDAKFALEEIHPDYFALSFVQTAQDIKNFRKFIGEKGQGVKIIAKIEVPMAIKHLDAIAQAADMLMVARGDMGAEMGVEKVPVMQRKIIAAAKKHNKPVIVATEMMMSMVNSPFPTRAEVSDVATAVYLKADSVMLSNETAVGNYPVETVTMMNKVLEFTEKHL